MMLREFLMTNLVLSIVKWFHIKFTSDDITAHSDASFIRQFITFSQSIDHPEELGLYSLKFRMDNGTAYYVSSPDQIAYQVKSILARFASSEVTRPNLNLLKLEFGKEHIF